MRYLAAALLILAALAVPAAAQQLTPSEIQAAIAAGSKIRPDQAGVLKGAGFNPAWLNTRMAIHTPETWIQVASAEAAAAYRPFTVANVDADATKPVLRVLFYPGSNVTTIVLRDVDRREAVQPLAMERCEEFRTFGRNQVENDCVEVEFNLTDVRRLQEMGRGEFLVTVRGIGEMFYLSANPQRTTLERDFKVDRGDLNKLPGLSASR